MSGVHALLLIVSQLFKSPVERHYFFLNVNALNKALFPPVSHYIKAQKEGQFEKSCASHCLSLNFQLAC